VIARNHRRLSLFSALLVCFVLYLNAQDQKPQVPLFKVEVNTVYMKVAVTDPFNRYVTGLQKEDFRIYEDNVQQTVSHFSQESAPVSVGILFDISGSMGFGRNDRIGKHWLKEFLQSHFLEPRNPDDEFFLITFNKTVNLVEALESTDIQNDIALQKSGGWTALFDAVYRGIDHVKQGKNEKKALILITDGEENSSRYRMSDIRDLCVESDVQIYSVGLLGPEGYGSPVLKTIASLTGGRSFFRSNVIQYDYFDLINAELRNQYLLGYIPTNTVRDGKWRKIRVKLDAPRGFPKLAIRTKSGYFAPKY
jgi:Ca-activated chloride channel homolog